LCVTDDGKIRTFNYQNEEVHLKESPLLQDNPRENSRPLNLGKKIKNYIENTIVKGRRTLIKKKLEVGE